MMYVHLPSWITGYGAGEWSRHREEKVASVLRHWREMIVSTSFYSEKQNGMLK